MAFEPVEDFENWYDYRSEDRDGCLKFSGISKRGQELFQRFEFYRSEHRKRVEHYDKYEMMADAEVVSRKPDLPNVSSGEIAGMVRRVARIVVQHTPNVEVICEFDDDQPNGILAKHILRSKIIGDETNSNEMQQNLFASVMSSFTLGFDAVVPVLKQEADGTWCMEYDSLHYQDVFPEPGVKDARKAPEIFVRRYLSKGEIISLIRNQPAGWDIPALRLLARSRPPSKQQESVSHAEKRAHTIPDGYEVITWYNSYGDPFLTFDAKTKALLRIEKNKDPLKRHPVQFLILEKDPQQPLGKSQVALVYGRQEFQDLMLNGAMKLWYKNINPTILGFGTGLNGVPNMSPGKYTHIPNPTAKIEAFEVNTQTLLQYGQISQQNQGSMINLVGAADQQMAATAGNGMSATPQGVEAQEALVDITTNNYQKAVENFFSRYCSYALTVFFAEMKGVDKLTPTADARRALVGAGLDETLFDREGHLSIKLSEMATVYSVRAVPGSLVEMEDEKQLRILNELFIPLSQSMNAIAGSGDPAMLSKAAAAMVFIIDKQIQLSGSAHADELSKVFREGPTQDNVMQGQQVQALEDGINNAFEAMNESNVQSADALKQMQEQISLITQTQQALLEQLGISSPTSGAPRPETAVPISTPAPVQ